MNQELQPKRLMDESVAIEQARELNKSGKTFDDGLVTDEQIVNEMMHTKIMCMPCKRKDDT